MSTNRYDGIMGNVMSTGMQDAVPQVLVELTPEKATKMLVLALGTLHDIEALLMPPDRRLPSDLAMLRDMLRDGRAKVVLYDS